MESKVIEYYDWSDIQIAICDEMGIDKKYFRDYHKLIGGDYKDLWHEWLRFFDSGLTNDTITRNDNDERMDLKIEWVHEEGKEWLEPFVRAVYAVWDKYEIEYVKYSW